MADPAQAQLLDYLLDTLDDSEREAIRRRLQDDPGLQDDLDRLCATLQPLEAARHPIDLPPRLAKRTCRMVFDRADSQAVVAELEEADHRPSPARRLRAMRTESQPSEGIGNRASWLDVTAAVAMVAVAFLLVFPAIQATRETARRDACGNNLRQIGQSLAQYSETNNGYFPSIPMEGRLAAAGAYAPILKSAHLLPDPSLLICPASATARQTIEVPSVDELMGMPEGPKLDRIRRQMGGSYGFSFGYMENGRYRGLENLGRASFALVSDSPDPRQPGHRSLNHGRGQNVLFESGNVRFVVEPTLADGLDNFFLNDAGMVGAGMHRNDSVIGSSGAAPIVRTSGLGY